jgi:hypothetical protein
MEQDEKPTGVRSQWMTVTPTLAQKWLEGNTHNRSLKQRKVEQYAADMKAGKWRQTHQGIAFDGENTLIDGQHRLWAVIESDATVVMLVTHGLAIDTQAVIDDHIHRTVLDQMQLAGDAESHCGPLHVAASNAMIWGPMPRSSVALTRQEQMDFIKKHWTAIDAVVAMFIPAKRGISIAPVMAACCRAFYHVDVESIAAFANILFNGRVTQPRDNAAFLLREWLIRRKAGGGGVANAEAYGKTARALKAFVANEKFTRLYAATDDLFPLPNPAVGLVKPKRRTSAA